MRDCYNRELNVGVRVAFNWKGMVRKGVIDRIGNPVYRSWRKEPLYTWIFVRHISNALDVSKVKSDNMVVIDG